MLFTCVCVRALPGPDLCGQPRHRHHQHGHVCLRGGLCWSPWRYENSLFHLQSKKSNLALRGLQGSFRWQRPPHPRGSQNYQKAPHDEFMNLLCSSNAFEMFISFRGFLTRSAFPEEPWTVCVLQSDVLFEKFSPTWRDRLMHSLLGRFSTQQS